MRHFEEMVTNSDWEEVEKYSMKIFFEIRKQKYLEDLDKDNEQLSKYGDTKSARGIMLTELRKLIEANPLFRDKLNFPGLKNSRLKMLINQSLNWQHHLCKTPKPNPDIKTLFIDHSCGQSQPNGAHAPSPVTNTLIGGLPKGPGIAALGAHGPFQPAPAQLSANLAGWMATSSVAHAAASTGPIDFSSPNDSGLGERRFIA